MDTKIEIKCVDDIKRYIKRNYLEPGNESQNRKLLNEGIEFVKNRIKYNELTNSGLNVDDMNSWVHALVRDKIGGQLTGTIVTWDLPNKHVTWDPISGEFTCESLKT